MDINIDIDPMKKVNIEIWKLMAMLIVWTAIIWVIASW